MEDQQENQPLPAAVLIVGLLLVLGCAAWSGSLFFFYKGSIIYGVIAGICVGAAYAFAKQIRTQFFSNNGTSK